MSTTGDRIKAARKQKGLSAEYVAERLGVSPATVYRYEAGYIEKVPGDTLLKIAAILGVKAEYLMGWAENAIPPYDNIIPMPRMNQIPLVGEIACGTPILAEQNIEDYIDMPDHLHADFALRCKGDSMKGARILDGDVVYIRQQPTVENGEIAAVLIDNEATLKRVYKSKGSIILQPENPDFSPLAFAGEQMAEVHIIGKAVAFTSIVK